MDVTATKNKAKDSERIRVLMEALALEDANLVSTQQALQRAQTAYTLALTKLRAVRDLLIKYLDGLNPYSLNPALFGVQFPSLGRERYSGMSPGDAAVQVLMDAHEPMTLDEIIDAIKQGGQFLPDARTVNAALIKKAGIGQDADANYFYKEEEVDPEDIPFE